MQWQYFSLLFCTTGFRGKADDCFGITEHERKENCDSRKVTDRHNKVAVLDHPEVWDWHSTARAEKMSVVRQAESKEHSSGRGEALQRPARTVHQQPYMHDVRRLVTGAELFYITDPNTVCCITVISLILICFRIKLDASAVTLTWMRYWTCICMYVCLHASKNFYIICGKFTFLVMNWYFYQLHVLTSVVAISQTFPPLG